MNKRQVDKIKIAAAAKADEEAIFAMAQARAALPNAPDYVRSDDANGRKIVVPVRAMAVGMLAHIEQAFARNHRSQR